MFLTPGSRAGRKRADGTLFAIKDANFCLVDDLDPSKKAQFQCSGISAGATRTYGLPDANATLLYNGGPLGTPASGTLDNCTTATLAVDTNTTALASTAFVLGQAGSANPIMNGSVAVGTSTRFARQDHVHPSDTSRAAISGTPSANQFAIWNSATAVQGVSLTGLVKGNGASAPTAAVAGTDYLAPPSGTAILKANSGGALANATAGTDYCAATSGSGVLKGSSGNTTAATAGTDFMHPGTTSNLTVGFTFTASNQGTVSSGTFTPAGANGNYQFYTNNGAHTLAAPAADSAMDILVTNGASAGTITFSGFTIASGNVGDALTTTNTSKFIISVRRINAVATYTVKALQ